MLTRLQGTAPKAHSILSLWVSVSSRKCQLPGVTPLTLNAAVGCQVSQEGQTGGCIEAISTSSGERRNSPSHFSASSRLCEVYLKVTSLFCERFLKQSFKVLTGKNLSNFFWKTAHHFSPHCFCLFFVGVLREFLWRGSSQIKIILCGKRLKFLIVRKTFKADDVMWRTRLYMSRWGLLMQLVEALWQTFSPCFPSERFVTWKSSWVQNKAVVF